jgi:hypothetical protein
MCEKKGKTCVVVHALEEEAAGQLLRKRNSEQETAVFVV